MQFPAHALRAGSPLARLARHSGGANRNVYGAGCERCGHSWENKGYARGSLVPISRDMWTCNRSQWRTGRAGGCLETVDLGVVSGSFRTSQADEP